VSEDHGNPGIDGSADTQPAPAAVLIDESCFLCVGLPREAPSGVDAPEFHYAFGFAEGVSQALRGQGYYLCERHAALVRKACVERGINWGKPERRIVG
jgi:hypothetical protein